MALLGLFVLLIVLIPLLVACALAAAAVGTVVRMLLEARAVHGERLAQREAPMPPVRVTEPAVEFEPAP